MIGTKRVIIVMVFTGTKLLALNVLSREQKFNQNYFSAMTAPELSNVRDTKGRKYFVYKSRGQ
jgi:hypothetical protein